MSTVDTLASFIILSWVYAAYCAAPILAILAIASLIDAADAVARFIRRVS